MLEAATAAAVQMMDVDDKAATDSQLGSTSTACGVSEAHQPAVESIEVDKENICDAPADRERDRADCASIGLPRGI